MGSLSSLNLQLSAPAAHNPPPASSPSDPAPTARPALSEIQNIALHAQPPVHPPSTRPAPPTAARKRASPFQFGARYLEAADDVFAWNAWDHVDPAADAVFVDYAARQLAFQRQHAVSDFDKRRYNATPHKWWDTFYKRNRENFYKDRKWLRQEFPVLAACTGATGAEALDERPARASPDQSNTAADASAGSVDADADAEPPPLEPEPDEHREAFAAELASYAKTGPWDTLLEIGAGAGNSAFPLLAANTNPRLTLHAVDFSAAAVALLRASPRAIDSTHLRPAVWDVAARGTLPPGVAPGSVDAALLVFAFSGLAPAQWGAAVRNVWRALRPGGEVCFRDYGRGDLAQVRFKKGRWLAENFYARGDGTRVYFFEEEELRRIWGGEVDVVAREAAEKNEGDERGGEESVVAGDESNAESEKAPAFEIVKMGTDRRLMVNRQKQLKMYRCWMQGRFRKPIPSE